MRHVLPAFFAVALIGCGGSRPVTVGPSPAPAPSAPTMPTAPVAADNRTQPPTPGPVRPVEFPTYVERTLPNGLKVVVVEQHEQPQVTIQWVARVGSAYDAKQVGLASLTAELLTRGTTTRNATEIAQAIDFVGGSLGASAGWDFSTVSASVLTKHLPVALDLLADVVRHPNFPEKEVTFVRSKRLNELVAEKDDAATLSGNRFSAVLYGPNHPYGAPSEGTEASVRAFRRSDAVAFYKKAFVPANSVLMIVGDVQPEAMLAEAAKRFGDLPTGTALAPISAEAPARASVGVYLVNKPGAVQSAISLGQVGIARNSPDYIPLAVMNTMLGGYFNSRINQNLRETKGYTYGAGSAFDTRLLAGPFAVNTQVRNEVTAPSVTEILAEIKRLRDEPVGPDEMKLIQDYMTGAFARQIETPGQIAGRVLTVELYGLPNDYWSTYRDRIRAVTAADIQRVARQYLTPDKLAIVIAGDAAAIKPSLAGFGPVEVVDADGKPM